jgi:hypothetical protein
MAMYKGQDVLVRRPFDEPEKVFVYDITGRYLCEGEADVLKGTGLTEDDLRRANKVRKKERAKLREYTRKIDELKQRPKGIVQIALEDQGKGKGKEYFPTEERLVACSDVQPPGTKPKYDAGAVILQFPNIKEEKKKSYWD